ncbi:hypothetical protein CK218_02225 [Mesorhizobium sp. WSM3879]|nr:hypothetical protein CK218_02225 [Mesorhizobium sp. WSM3879]
MRIDLRFCVDELLPRTIDHISRLGEEFPVALGLKRARTRIVGKSVSHGASPVLVQTGARSLSLSRRRPLLVADDEGELASVRSVALRASEIFWALPEYPGSLSGRLQFAADPSRLLPFGVHFGSKPIPLGAQFDGIYIDRRETVVVFGHCSQSPFGVQRNASALVPGSRLEIFDPEFLCQSAQWLN